jgi:hypothetical protein
MLEKRVESLLEWELTGDTKVHEGNHNKSNMT